MAKNDCRPIKERLEDNISPCPITGCWLWLGCPGSNNGYGHLYIRGRGTIAAHRAAWEAYNGPIPNGLLVLHHCDVPLCVNPNHLFLGTQLDNIADRDRKGRTVIPRGEHSGQAKVTTVIVLAIRASNESLSKLSRKYNISKTQVADIRNHKSWKHVP